MQEKFARKLVTLHAKEIQKKTLAVCPITGITISLNVPALYNQEGTLIALKYTNPLTEPENFLKFAELPTSELLKLEQPILAGILLAILNHFHLIEDKLSSVEKNLLLQKVHPLTLIKNIKFFSRLQITRIRKLPKLAFSVEECKNSTTTDVLNNYRNCVNEIVYECDEDKIKAEQLYKRADEAYKQKLSEIVQSEENIRKEAIRRAQATREQLQHELLVKGRKLIRELSKQSDVSENVINYLRTLFTKDFILVAADSMRQTAIKVLEKYSHIEECNELCNIIKNPIMNNHVGEFYCGQQDLEAEEESMIVQHEIEEQEKKEQELKLTMEDVNKMDSRELTRFPIEELQNFLQVNLNQLQIPVILKIRQAIQLLKV